MASKKLYVKDLRCRLSFARYNDIKNLYKFLSNDFLLPFGLKRYIFCKLSFFNKNFSVVRIRNRCIYTYRARSVHSMFMVSRMCLREFIWKLLLPGVSQISW